MPAPCTAPSTSSAAARETVVKANGSVTSCPAGAGRVAANWPNFAKVKAQARSSEALAADSSTRTRRAGAAASARSYHGETRR